MNNQQIINPEVLDKYGPALTAILGKLVSAGFGDIQLQLETLIKLDGDVDKDVMVRAAHSIKSCSAQLGGELLSCFSLEKEQQYISGELETLSSDIAVFSEMFEDLKREMEGVLLERGLSVEKP
ncbi:MAG: HPt (histidine-containing phosphotransfer) domain-containing protein [Pseudohongiellaceae bacterium]|jgi:HPt (histidine-containing phosphotransfer) domain-containing protein